MIEVVDATKSDDSIVYNDNSDKKDDQRSHKKRLRLKQRSEKQEEVSKILEKFDSIISEKNNLEDIFQSVKISEEDVSSFWSQVPEDCSPHHAKLTQDIVSQHLLGVEQARQEKLIKKLEKQFKLGIISEEAKQAQLVKIGRNNLKKSDENDSFSLLGSDRALRKKQQVDNIAAILKLHTIGDKKVVVDFGSGSGNLCLSLASVYTSTTFVFVDQNQTSLNILKQRAEEGGLMNIKIKHFQFNSTNLPEFIQDIKTNVGDIELGIGLHSCGSFTDLVMELCRLCRCECLIIPCCNGKIDSSTSQYPRSQSVSSIITSEQYHLISRAADNQGSYKAKCAVEIDRARWAEESGAQVAYSKMNPVSATPKHLMIYCKF